MSLAVRAPEVAVAEARVGEARALRVGAGVLAPMNPELTALGGPRWYPNGDRSADLLLSLAWPIDVSGARSARKEAADGAVAVAEAEAADTRLVMAAEATNLWIESRGAAERLALARLRVGLDDELVRIAGVRRQAGVTGDSEIALAKILAADSHANMREAAANEKAALALLAGKLGVPASRPLMTSGALADVSDPPPVEILIARLGQRPDVVRAERALPARRAEAAREASLGLPVPRVVVGGGHENETFARFGLDVPVPVYQRNQTSRAVADARVETAGVLRGATLVAAEAELRAAYATFVGASEALELRANVLTAVADVEKLAWRAYELGSMPLATVVMSRREAAAARVAHLDASIALARARVALDRASGVVPQ